jgi:hypothetical protein
VEERGSAGRVFVAFLCFGLCFDPCFATLAVTSSGGVREHGSSGRHTSAGVVSCAFGSSIRSFPYCYATAR